MDQRKGAKVQRRKDFQSPCTITHWVNHLHLAFHCHLPVPCVLASWRLCVSRLTDNELCRTTSNTIQQCVLGRGSEAGQGQFMILTNPLQTQGLALSLDATPPAFQAWGHTPPSQQPRCTHGISPVYPRCISHVDGINMGDTPGIYRSNTVAIPWRHRSDTGPGVVSSLEGTQGADPS